MTRSPQLLVRTDGGDGIGYGHLGRCLALAEEWIEQGGAVDLCSDQLPPVWAGRWRAAGVTLHDGVSTDLDPHALVIDGYHLSPLDLHDRYGARPLLQIDDHGLSQDHAAASIIVDQNHGAAAASYRDALPSTRLLLGSRYALLRSAVREGVDASRTAAQDEVVVFPGGDPRPETSNTLRTAVALLRRAGFRVVEVDGSEEVTSSFGSASVALLTAGSTAWELAALGIPMVVLPIAENQGPVAEALEAVGAARRMQLADGPDQLCEEVTALLANAPLREHMSVQGRRLIDGRGTARVAAVLRGELLKLRPATEEDAGLLWEWVNDPISRQSAFDQRPIAWADHRTWLMERLYDRNVCLLIASDPNGSPIGQFRVEVVQGVGLVDVSVAPDQRGRGWAAPLIAAASRRAMSQLARIAPTRLEARVRMENVRSARAFERADYDHDVDASHGVVRWHTYTWGAR